MKPPDASTVFVIDDDADVRASIQGLLKSVGLRSQCFGTTQEFLRNKRPDEPSCLVLDVRLPGVNGLDFQRELADAGVQIPIVFITAHGDIPDDGEGHEIRSRRVPDQALPGSRPAGCDKSGIGSRPGRTRQRQAELADLRKRYESLTAREREVMSLVVSGHAQ